MSVNREVDDPVFFGIDAADGMMLLWTDSVCVAVPPVLLWKVVRDRVQMDQLRMDQMQDEASIELIER